MSVMKCSRINCDQCMCNWHAQGIGYVCTTCFDEMLKEFDGTIPTDQQLRDFLSTPIAQNQQQPDTGLYLRKKFAPE